MTQDLHRVAFGRMLYNWRKRHGWTQYSYCEAVGPVAISYGNLSVIENGKAGELRQKAFFQLEEMNLRVQHKDWKDVKDHELLALLEKAEPIGDEDVPVWGAVEFWSCYIGRRPVPEALRSGPPEDETLRQKLIKKGWVTEFNADTLVRLIEGHFAPKPRKARKRRQVA